jgi:hypoxanthine phosphoribosyltransferase
MSNPPPYQAVLQEILIDEATLQARIRTLGAQLSQDYAHSEDLLLVCVLKGGVVFLNDLMRHISVPHAIDFLAVSSYGKGARSSSGEVRIVMDLHAQIQGRDVLVVEDIIDSGRTLSYLLEVLRARQPHSLKLCTLLDKPSRREIQIQCDYVGFQIEDKFVFGYGLDLDEYYRNLPFVGVAKL